MSLIIGVITIYRAGFVGSVLYCDTPARHLVYDERTAPWVALDVRLYQSGWAHCGDVVLLRFQDGTELRAIALDAGPLHKFRVEQWGDAPLIADVPAHLAPFRGLSIPGSVINVSAARRELAERAGQ